jgi:hypothetical protein
MGFIQDEILPLTPFEDKFISEDDLIRSDEHLESMWSEPALSEFFPLLLVAVVGQNFEAR